MKKTFKLPKDFTKKWLEELRSGKYEQGTAGRLCDTNYLYCCLGVACKLVIDDIGDDYEIPKDMVDALKGTKFPKLLMSDSKFKYKDNLMKNTLVGVLTELNDGIGVKTLEAYNSIYPNLVYTTSEPNEIGKIQYSFNEIADFIEANVELI